MLEMEVVYTQGCSDTKHIFNIYYNIKCFLIDE
jgi:hypothetical protein